MIRALLVAVFALTTTTASAQSLDEMAKQSVFVQKHIEYMKRKNSITVYSGNKAYCPGISWYTSRNTLARKVVRAYRQQISRQMSASGFGAAAINHCVENSGFVLENGRLMDHPKNTKYNSRARAGTMIVRDTKTGVTREAPMMVETSSFDDNNFNVFDQQFKKVCSMTPGSSSSMRLKCGAYGTLDGTFTNQDSGRKSIAVRNERFQMLIVTGRPVSFARKSFARAYN